MEAFATLLTTALISIFFQNTIFERAFGTNVLLYCARKKENLLGFSFGVVYITTISAIVIYFIDGAMAQYEIYEIIMPFLYILVISIIYIISLVTVWKFLPKVFVKIRKYVHLSVFNCCVLGALFLNSQYGHDIFSYIGYGLGTGLGFLLAAYLLYIGHKRLYSELVPAAFRGLPIMIIYVGILSLAFHAFIGYSVS